MYERLLKRLNGAKSKCAKDLTFFLDEDDLLYISLQDNVALNKAKDLTFFLDDNDLLCVSLNELVVLKYYPNDDYSYHGSKLWADNTTRTLIKALTYNPFLNRDHFITTQNSIITYSGLYQRKELFSTVSVNKPQAELVSVKEGFLVRREHLNYKFSLDVSQLMRIGQDLEPLKDICNKMAGIILTNETSILTTPNVISLIIWFFPQQQKFNVSVAKSNVPLTPKLYYRLEQNTYSAVDEYLNYILQDYTAPEGYEYNPLIIKYTLPLNLNNPLDQTILLADILDS